MRRDLLLAPLLLLALTGCSQPQVVVEAQLEHGAIADLPVRLLPYDREALVDSLTRAAKEPEPPVPPLLVQQEDTLHALEAELRDGLAALQDMGNPGGGPAGRLDQREDSVKQRILVIRPRIAALRESTAALSDSLRQAREAWAATALRDFDEVVRKRVDAADRSEVADTTGSDGRASFRVEPGRWWVYARYTLPDVELSWSVPVEVADGVTQVRLSEENAKRKETF